MLRTVWKGVMADESEAEVWYEVLKKYTYQQAKTACMKYITEGHYEPKPADILGCIPKGTNGQKFDPKPKFANVNGKNTRVYTCQRCMDQGMIAWDDENGNLVGVPCDCPAGHHYFRWGWLTPEEQKAYIDKNGQHGEIVGENWYLLQPERWAK